MHHELNTAKALLGQPFPEPETPKKKLVITRSKWVRFAHSAQINGESKLLNEDGNMCCLGFDCIMNGAGPQEICEEDYPSDIGVKCSLPTNAQREAVQINDRTKMDYSGITDAQQEQLLINLFAKHGVELSFVD